MFAGEAAVVGSHAGLGEPSVLHSFGKMSGNTFSHTAGIDKDQRRAMFGNQVGQSVVHFSPDLRCHDRLQRGAWEFDSEVPLPHKAGIDDLAVIRTVAVTEQERCHALDGFLGGGNADPLRR